MVDLVLVQLETRLLPSNAALAPAPEQLKVMPAAPAPAIATLVISTPLIDGNTWGGNLTVSVTAADGTKYLQTFVNKGGLTSWKPLRDTILENMTQAGWNVKAQDDLGIIVNGFGRFVSPPVSVSAQFASVKAESQPMWIVSEGVKVK